MSALVIPQGSRTLRPADGWAIVDDRARQPERIIACEACGMVQRLPGLTAGSVGRCAGCGTGLCAPAPGGLEHALAYCFAALILFVIAHSFPFMTLEIEGRAQQSTLLTGVRALNDEGMWPLAILVLLTATVMPLLKLLGNIYVLLPLRLGRQPWHAGSTFRRVDRLRRWAMMEVYLLGVIVAYVKLSDLAAVDLGVALYAFVGLIVLMAAADAAFDPLQVWSRIRPQASPGLLRSASGAALVSCHGCGQLALAPEAGTASAARCTRCGDRLHRRKPNSISRTWALLIAAAILYIPANMLPIMTVTYFGRGHPDTILSGIRALVEAGMWPVALLVFFASITVPVLKLIGLAFLLISVQRASPWRPRDRTLLYRIIEGIGRWSMVDIFMISILVALVSLGAIATIEPGAGALAFASVVVITMLASLVFDPRLIWDVQEDRGGDRPTLRA